MENIFLEFWFISL